MMEDIQETRLENGLVILTDRMAGVRSATLGFYFRVGARHEPSQLAGIAHFIEHTVFKGTQKRSALEIAIEQDRLGGGLDAFTTHEETGYSIKVIDDQVPAAFDLLSDMLMDSRFDQADLESEQKVIIEEMKMIEDSPEDHLGEIFGQAFFPGHPLGMNIAGSAETVQTFDHETTRSYHKENYAWSNMVFVGAGNIEHQQIVDLVLNASGNVNGPFRRDLITTAPRLAAPIVVKQNSGLEQAHLVIATPFVSAPDERRYAANLLESILGDGMSSRLWQKIREERGLAYSVGASTVMFQDVGTFSIGAATSPEQVGEVVDLAIAEMREVVKNGVTADELSLAKQQTASAILLSLEDSASRAESLAQLEMTHGRQISLEESLENLNAVTLEDIQGLAVEYFRTEDIAFGALGDLDGLTIDRDRLSI